MPGMEAIRNPAVSLNLPEEQDETLTKFIIELWLYGRMSIYLFFYPPIHSIIHLKLFNILQHRVRVEGVFKDMTSVRIINTGTKHVQRPKLSQVITLVSKLNSSYERG